MSADITSKHWHTYEKNGVAHRDLMFRAEIFGNFSPEESEIIVDAMNWAAKQIEPLKFKEVCARTSAEAGKEQL
jgi:hypothetical protein